MKKNDTEKEAPRKRGRPAGSTKETPGLLHIAPADIIGILDKTNWYTTLPDFNAKAVLKVPKSQAIGANGKTISTRIYTPNTWNNRPVLCILLTDQQAAALKKADLLTQAAAIDVSETETKPHRKS